VDLLVLLRELFSILSTVHDYHSDRAGCSLTICTAHKTLFGYWERRGAVSVLAGKHEGKRPLGRPKHRWVDNMKMNLQEVEWGHGLD